MRLGLAALATLTFCSTALLGGPAPVPSVQAFEVRVRGSAELELDAVGAGTTLGVRGRLIDDVGVGLAQRRVDVVVRDSDLVEVDRARLHTDFGGMFRWSTEQRPGVYSVEVEHGGSEHLSVANARASVRLVRQEVELRVDAPAFVHGPAPAPVALQASSGGVGVATFVSVYRAGAPVASAELDSFGRATLDVAPFTERGDNAFEFVVEPTPFRSEVREARSMRRGDDVVVQGDAHRVFLRLQRGWELIVSVADERGGIADLPVSWTIERTGYEPIEAESFTDASGVATYFLETSGDEQGRFSARATIAPPAGEVLLWPGRSWEVAPAPWERRVRWLAIVAVALALLWFGRAALQRSARMVRAWWGRVRAFRRSTGQRAEGMVADLQRGHERVAFMAIDDADLDGAEPTDVVVELWDRWRGRVVEQGILHIEHDASSRETAPKRPVGAGLFRAPRPERGELTLVARAPGFVEVRATLRPTSPARVRLKMTPVPLKIREIYRWLVERAHGEDLWGSLTPAQIAATLARHRTPAPSAGDDWREQIERWTHLQAEERPGALLELLTAAVEETNFSGRDYDVELWHQVREIVMELDRLGAAEGPPPKGAL